MPQEKKISKQENVLVSAGGGVIRQRPEPARAGRAEIQRSLSADLREPAERIAIFKMAA